MVCGVRIIYPLGNTDKVEAFQFQLGSLYFVTFRKSPEEIWHVFLIFKNPEDLQTAIINLNNCVRVELLI